MSKIDDLLNTLRTEDIDVQWCGPGGLFNRAYDMIERLRETLIDVGDLIDGYVDVRDGTNGQLPNDAMKASQLIDEALL